MTQTIHYCSLAAIVYVSASVFTAVVRWFHTCEASGGDRQYYYPGRMVAVLAFLLPLVLIPYALNPADEEAWLMARAFFPMVLPAGIAAMLLAYFGSVKQWSSWRPWVLAFTAPMALLILVLFALSVIPGYHCPPETRTTLMTVTATVALLSTANTIAAVVKVTRWIRLSMEEHYSNEEDFPTDFARRILWMVVLVIALIWVGFALDNRAVMAVVQLTLTVINIRVLLMVLPTHRHRPPLPQVAGHDDEPLPQANKSVAPAISQERADYTLEQVRAAVEGDNLYLKPHLTLNEVVERCTFGRTYVSQVLQMQYGGFFKYINRLRLEYAERYRAEHPDALLDEVATASGFTSRQAMSNVRRRMSDHGGQEG